MAREVTTSNYLKKATAADVDAAGTIFVRFKPNWSAGDGGVYVLWAYDLTGGAFLYYYRFSNLNVYLGWSTTQIVVADTGLFTSGVWANHLYDWDDTANLQHLYVDNTLASTQSGAFSAVATSGSFIVGASGNILGEGTNGANGHVAEWARWSRVLTSDERSTLQTTGNPACIPDGLVRHYKILGNESPEPDEINVEDLAVVGSPTQSTHPTVGACATTINPSRIESTETFYAPTISGTQTVTPSRIASTETFYAPTLSDVVQSEPYTANGHTAALYHTLPSNPIKLIMYHSGVGEDYQSILTDSLKEDVINTLFAAGYYISGLSAGENWGNQDAIDSYNDLYSQIAGDYTVTRTGLLSQSMGGLSGLLCLADGTVDVKGWYGIYPVCDLRNLYDLGTYAAAIRAAYGIEPGGSDYDALTAGHDPMLRSASEFPAIRYRFTASSGDTTVPKADNSDDFSALIASRGIEESVVAASGNHGDPSHFDAADVLAFFERSTQDYIYPSRVESTVQFFAPTIGDVITASRIESALQFFAPTVPETFTMTRIESDVTFYAPTVSNVGPFSPPVARIIRTIKPRIQ